jgi:hypothetical protein
MRLRDATARQLRDIRDDEVGPERLMSVVRELEEDVARLPLGVEPPPTVAEAHKAFQAAAAWARQVSGAIEEAEQAVGEAKRQDVETRAASVLQDKPRPKLTQIKAGEAVVGARVDLEAAEQLLCDSHSRLLAAALEAWADWRSAMLQYGSERHLGAAQAGEILVAPCALRNARGFRGMTPPTPGGSPLRSWVCQARRPPACANGQSSTCSSWPRL